MATGALVAATVAYAGGEAVGQAVRSQSGAAASAASATVTDMSLAEVGTANARSIAASTKHVHPTQDNERFLLGPEGNLQRSAGSGATAPAAAPTTDLSPSSSAIGTSGFLGITGAQQATVNSAYDLEPPDQGLCSDGTNIVEAVNNAYAVYSTTGAQVLAPIPLTSLFGIASENAGSFTSDPHCYFDSATDRWFVVELSIPNYFTKQHSSKSYELVAVSDSADPAGTFTTFAIDTTDPNDAGCPCFGDYPMIGADANGFYVTTNEFSIYKSPYNGVQLYAMSKQGLEAAAAGTAAPPTVVHVSNLASPFPGEPVGDTYHMSPALVPSGGSFDADAGGTELFTMSDVFPVSSDLLAVYALSNTSSLSSATPDVVLSSSLVTLGQTYQFPESGMAVAQAPATSASQTPLLDYVESQTGASVPEGVLQADFDAVQETTYADGDLFTELTNASSPTAAVGAMTAEWFVLAPSVNSSGVSASLVNEGNMGVKDQSLLYPDLVVNSSGAGDMVFTLTGPRYFPSAAYVSFGGSGPTGKVQVAAAGSGPEDGFTCYAYFVGTDAGGCRWGDFSGGVAVGSTVLMATEYIPPASTRDFYTNWGTFIFQAPPG